MFTHRRSSTASGPEKPALFKTSESSRRDPGQAGTARVTNFTPHAGSGTCRAPTCEHATLCSHPMRRQLRQRAVVGKPGRRTARPKFGNTELSAQPTVASNGGQQYRFSRRPSLRGASGKPTAQHWENNRRDEMPEKTKRCRKCGEVKSVESFPRDKSRPDGLYAYCNRCNTERVTAINRQKTRERQEAKRLDAIANPMTEKRCSGCKTVRSLDQFQKEPSGLAGRRSKCNGCRNIDDRRRYIRDISISRRNGRLRARSLSERLSDSYIRALLTKGAFITSADVPQSLVELKRIQLRIKRMVEGLKDEER